MPADEPNKPTGHTVADHLYGQDLMHVHDGDADHDHDGFVETGRSRTTRSGSRTTSR